MLPPCDECNGRGQVAPGTLCPVCLGQSVATPTQVAAYRENMRQAALDGATERARRLGAAAVDLNVRDAAQARTDAAGYLARAEQAARRAEHALARMAAGMSTAKAHQLQSAWEALAPLEPRALPAPQPPQVGPYFPGAARDPVIYADTISARQIDVWQQLNLASGALLNNLPFVVVAPSGDSTGVTDLANINAAVSTLGGVTGLIWLLPVPYYWGAAGFSLPPYMSLWGIPHGTVINYVGAGTATALLQSNPNNPQTYTRLSSTIRDLIIDGTSAGNGAIGFQLQDVNGVDFRVVARNFTGTGSVGIQIANNTHSLNHLNGFGRAENCTNGLVFTTLGAQQAMEHIYVSWSINSNTGQNPIVLANSVGVQGSHMMVNVGCAVDSGPVITFGAGCVFSTCHFIFKAELTQPATSCSTVSFNGAGSGWGAGNTGILFFSPNFLPSNAIAAGVKVTFSGAIINDAPMQSEQTPAPGTDTFDGTFFPVPAFPGATGTVVQNTTGYAILATVAGGTLSGNFGQVSGPPFPFTATNASPCVFTIGVSSGLANNQRVILASGAPTGFNNNQVYFVVNASGATFQLSLTQGGGAINSTSTGAGTLGPLNTVGDVNTRVFMIPRNMHIVLNWSAAPSGWTIQPLG